MFGPGIFGDAFDFDGDGKLDCFESAAEIMAYEAITNPDIIPNADARYGLERAGFIPACDLDDEDDEEDFEDEWDEDEED